MAHGNSNDNNIYSANDALDINELASLNDDFSPEFLEQLQNQLAQNAGMAGDDSENLPPEKDVTELFEEVNEAPQTSNSSVSVADDDFAKKFKAKMNKQKLGPIEENPQPEPAPEPEPKEEIPQEVKVNVAVQQSDKIDEEIEGLSGGNIVERPLSPEQVSYNESLDYLDENVKYSKYVIYIDPENAEFIDSLSVRERKNLINKILREQDDIVVTQRRLNTTQTVLKHIVIAVVTLAISIPVVYLTINTALEASINNYRRSQSIFQTLYKEKGKIKTNINR